VRDGSCYNRAVPKPPAPCRGSSSTAGPSSLSLSRKSRALRAAVIAAVGVLAWCWLRSNEAGAAGRAAASASRPAASAGTAAIDRARRAAAVAVAQEPGDLRPLEQGLHAAAASATLARCGGDDVAQYGPPPEPTGQDGMLAPGPPPLIKPAGPVYVAATQRIDAALRSSGDPYARAVADWLNVGDARSPDDRIAALVNDAASARDPRVYGLAYHACRPFGIGATPAPACALLSARQWATLDPGNGVPWLAALADARAQGDTEGQREALYRMASSTRWREGYADAPAIVGMQLPDDDASATADVYLTMKAMTASLGISLQAVALSCKDKAGGDVNLAQQCVAIAHVMDGQSDTILDHLVGGTVYLQATGDPSLRDTARADYRLMAAAAASASATSTTPATSGGCADYRVLGRFFKRAAEIGELAALRERGQAPSAP
jgi:hypothetical protein